MSKNSISTKPLEDISTLKKFMSDLIERYAPKSVQDKIRLLRDTIPLVEIDTKNLQNDYNKLQDKIIPFQDRFVPQGDDNRLSAVHFCYVNIVNMIRMKHPRKAGMYAMRELDYVSNYITGLETKLFVPTCYKEWFCYSLCDEYLYILNLPQHPPILFFQIQCLEKIGIELEMFSQTPDLITFTKPTVSKKEFLNFGVPDFVSKELREAMVDKSKLYLEMISKLEVATKQLPKGNVRCLMKLKIAVIKYQNEEYEETLSILFKLAKKFRILNNFGRCYYCYILAYHCTTEIKTRVYILFQLLSLHTIDDELLHSIGVQFKIQSHHLLKKENVKKELIEIMKQIPDEHIQTDNAFSLYHNPTVVTSHLSISN